MFQECTSCPRFHAEHAGLRTASPRGSLFPTRSTGLSFLERFNVPELPVVRNFYKSPRSGPQEVYHGHGL